MRAASPPPVHNFPFIIYNLQFLMSRLSTPIKIGLFFALLGITLTVIGIARGAVPLQPANIAMALLIGGGVWFVVAWAVATAAVDVEEEVEEL
jgi:hypothetical protein